MKMKRRKQKKGAALIIAVILCGVLMVIASTLAYVSVNESESSVKIDDSTNAYNDAKAGLSWAQYFVNYDTTQSPYVEPAGSYSFGSGSINVVIDKIPNGGSVREIDSSGTVNNITRKIVYYLTNYNKAIQSCSGSGYTMASPQSGDFTWQFDFTLVSGSTSASVNLDDQSSNYLSMIYSKSSGSPLITLGINGVSTGTAINLEPTGIYTNGGTLYDSLRFRAIVKYIKNIAAEIQIEYRDPSGNLDCLGTTFAPLTSSPFGGSTFSTVKLGDPANSSCQADTYTLSDTSNIAVDNMILQKGTQ